jgi:ferritin-like metal-binding protein YciE
MKALKSKPAQTKLAHDDFESALVAELQHLRTSERKLQRMYPRLKTAPQLRSEFVEQLAEMQLRAERLDAVLNPFTALRSPIPVNAVRNMPAA